MVCPIQQKPALLRWITLLLSWSLRTADGVQNTSFISLLTNIQSPKLKELKKLNVKFHVYPGRYGQPMDNGLVHWIAHKVVIEMCHYFCCRCFFLEYIRKYARLAVTWSTLNGWYPTVIATVKWFRLLNVVRPIRANILPAIGRISAR